MPGRIEGKAQVVIHPAGKGAGGFADVILGVVADTHGEQLHHLAAEILVRGALHIVGGVEKNKHRGVFGDGCQQVAERPQRTRPQRRDLRAILR